MQPASLKSGPGYLPKLGSVTRRHGSLSGASPPLGPSAGAVVSPRRSTASPTDASAGRMDIGRPHQNNERARARSRWGRLSLDLYPAPNLANKTLQIQIVIGELLISSGAQLHARARYRRPQAPVSTRSCMDVALHLTSWRGGRPHPTPSLPAASRGGGRNLLLIMTRCDRPAMHRPAARVSYIWFLLNWSAR